MDLELKTATADIGRLNPTFRDLGITPARLVAIGLDTRLGQARDDGTVEIQYLVPRNGETPLRVHEFDIIHRPAYAYLWNFQMGNRRAVVEGDPDIARVINTPAFARVHDVLAGLIRGSRDEASGEAFLVGSSKEPYSWDASGRGFNLVFGEKSRRRFLRIRRNDILWAEGERLVAAPSEALSEAGTATKTRSIFTAPGPIAMLSKVYGWTGARITASTGRNDHTELDLGENAADPKSKLVITRTSRGRGLFVGNTSPNGKGLKALITLEISDKGGWRLAVFPIESARAPASDSARAAS